MEKNEKDSEYIKTTIHSKHNVFAKYIFILLTDGFVKLSFAVILYKSPET